MHISLRTQFLYYNYYYNYYNNQIFLGLPLGLAPSTSIYIHFLAQSSISFLSNLHMTKTTSTYKYLNNRVHQNVSLHISFLIFYDSLIGCIILLPKEVVLWIVIGYKNTISGGSSIMQPIRIPENMRNVILMMNLINLMNIHDIMNIIYSRLVILL